MSIGNYLALKALSDGQCEIIKGVMLYSPAGLKRLGYKADGKPFNVNEADFWITIKIPRNEIIPMYGTENITAFLEYLLETKSIVSNILQETA